MNYKEIIGSNIKTALKKKGETQVWLAEKMESYPSHVSKWLSGDSLPKPDKMEDIASVLDTTVKKLLSGNFDEEEEANVSYSVEIFTGKSMESDYKVVMGFVDQIIEADNDSEKQVLRKKISERLRFMFDFYQSE